MKHKFLSKLTAFAVAGTMLAMPVAADSAADGSLGADINVVLDQSAGDLSVEATVDLGGGPAPFVFYMDGSNVLVSATDTGKVFSYDYTALPTEGFLAENVGADQLTQLNDSLTQGYAAMMGDLDVSDVSEAAVSAPDLSGAEEYVEGVMTAVYGKIGEITPEEAEAKDIETADGTITAQGVKVTVNGEWLASLYDGVMNAENSNGVPFSQFLNDMIQQVNAQRSQAGVDLSSISGMISQGHDLIASLPEIELAMYANDDGMPLEFDLTAEGSTLSLVLRGTSDAPWTHIDFCVDGESLLSLVIEMDESSFKVSLAMSGEELGTFSVDLSTGEFSLDIAMLGAPITGKFGMDGDAVVADLSFASFNITFRASEQGPAAKPEGEVVDLMTATAEEIEPIFNEISSYFEEKGFSDAA